ncbi:MAG: hypothetical protein EGP94_02415 [Lachnospiraceae bacterium]|nr:hypothetical protein [Lachnospiraceae bacterium]
MLRSCRSFFKDITLILHDCAFLRNLSGEIQRISPAGYRPFPFRPQWDSPKAFLLYGIETSYTTKNPGTFSRTGIFIR